VPSTCRCRSCVAGTASCRETVRSPSTARSGSAGYYAVRFLLQQAYRAANLSGGWTTYQAFRAAKMLGPAASG